MAFPGGVATRIVQVGPDLINNGSNVTGSVTISLYEQVIWTATHTSILKAPKTYQLAPGGFVLIQLPNTSQAGFVDTAGNAITGWLYKITYNLYGISEDNEPDDMYFAVPASGSTLFLNDLIDTAPPAAPVRVGIQPVLTVDGNGPDVNGNAVSSGGGGGGGASDLASITDMSTIAKAFNDNGLTTTAQMRGVLDIVDPSGFMATVLDDTTAGAVLTTLGLSTFVKTLMDDADGSAFLTTLGVSTFAKTLLDDADASAALTTLGVSTYAKTLLDDTTAGAAQTTLGISAYAQTLLDDTTASAARTTLGATSTGSSLFTATDVAAAISTLGLAGLAATLTALQDQVNTSPVMVIESAGTYTVPAGTSSLRTRIFKGVVDPTGLAIFRAGTDVALLEPA